MVDGAVGFHIVPCFEIPQMCTVFNQLLRAIGLPFPYYITAFLTSKNRQCHVVCNMAGSVYVFGAHKKTVMLMVDVNEALRRLCWNDYYRPQTKFGAS